MIEEKESVAILSKEDEAMSLFLEYQKTKDKKLRNKIALKNQALVTYAINKYYSSKLQHKISKEDLLQEGCIGLMAAIDGFDPGRGFRFSTYSMWWIRQAVNNYLINIEPVIHVPPHIKTAQNKLLRKLKEENMELQELILDITKKESLELTNNMLNNISLAANSKMLKSLEDEIYMQDGSKSYFKDLIEDQCGLQDKKLDRTKVINFMTSAFEKLSNKEKLILLLRFDVINKEEVYILCQKWKEIEEF